MEILTLDEMLLCRLKQQIYPPLSMNAFASNEHNGKVNRKLSYNKLYVLIPLSCILTVCQTLI